MRLFALFLVFLIVSCSAPANVEAQPEVAQAVETPVEVPAVPTVPEAFQGVYELAIGEIGYGDRHLLRVGPETMEVIGLRSGQNVVARDGGIAFEMVTIPAEYLKVTPRWNWCTNTS